MPNLLLKSTFILELKAHLLLWAKIYNFYFWKQPANSLKFSSDLLSEKAEWECDGNLGCQPSLAPFIFMTTLSKCMKQQSRQEEKMIQHVITI